MTLERINELRTGFARVILIPYARMLAWDDPFNRQMVVNGAVDRGEWEELLRLAKIGLEAEKAKSEQPDLRPGQRRLRL